MKLFANLEPVIEALYISRDDMPTCSFCKHDVKADWILSVDHLFGEFDVNFCNRCLDSFVATVKKLKGSNEYTRLRPLEKSRTAGR